MNSSFLVEDENVNPVEDALQYISIMAYRNEFIFKNIDNAHIASQIITTIRTKKWKSSDFNPENEFQFNFNGLNQSVCLIDKVIIGGYLNIYYTSYITV